MSGCLMNMSVRDVAFLPDPLRRKCGRLELERAAETDSGGASVREKMAQMRGQACTRMRTLKQLSNLKHRGAITP